MELKLSTITPCYRMGKYLNKFLDDIRNQTLFPNFEVIIDHNEPEQWEVELVKKYQKEYPNGVIKHIITNPTIPVSSSMNKCIQNSDSDVLTIWNVDDLRTPDSLEKQYKVLSNKNICVANINFTIVGSFGVKNGRYIDHTIYPEIEYKRSMILGPFFMFKKDICKKAGYFDEQFKSGADFDFAIRLAHNGKISFAPGNGGYYLNERKGASTNPNSVGELEKTVIYLRYGINKIEKEGCTKHLLGAKEKYDIENITNFSKKYSYKTFINGISNEI